MWLGDIGMAQVTAQPGCAGLARAVSAMPMTSFRVVAVMLKLH